MAVSHVEYEPIVALPRKALPWLAGAAMLLVSVAFVLPSFVNRGEPNASRQSFTGSTQRSLTWIEYCLAADWGGRLTLRQREPPASSKPMSRLDNPVLRIIVDVTDEGDRRTMKAYTRHGERFTRRELQALDGCLTGAVFALADPRSRNVR